jgi:hypothetical protein
MREKSPFNTRNVVFEPVESSAKLVELEMTKSYHRFRLFPQNSSGFAVGLADFACLGWRMYDIAGYPYDNEQSALYSDWVKLGEDVEVGKKQLEEAAGQ